MTSISVEFRDVPMSVGDHGSFVYGHGDKTVCEISFTVIVEADTRETWEIDEILFWEIGSLPHRIIYYGLDRGSSLFTEIKKWLDNDDDCIERINTHLALAILPSGELVQQQ